MANTTYEYIFQEFKDKITDPDLLLFSEDLQADMLISLMRKAIARCRRMVSETVDLSLQDDELLEFAVEIPDEVIDIITEWMTVFWLQPYVNNADNLRNNLSTKAYSFFSPANLLEKIGDRYDTASKRARGLANEYSFIAGDFSRLTS